MYYLLTYIPYFIWICKPDYGVKKKNRVNAEDLHKVRLDIFDKSVHLDHTLKVMVGCGAFLGFRSIKEHLHLHKSDFLFGRYGPGHKFAGLDYVKIDVLRGAKFTKDITTSNVYYADMENNMRIPIFT